MKKKIISLILTICLIIPVTLSFAGCTTTTTDEGFDLAGKKVVVDVETIHVNWEHLSYMNSYYDFENAKLYQTEMTLQNFIQTYTSEGIFSRVLNKPNLDTVDKVKSAIIEYGMPLSIVQYPNFIFSEDASSVSMYAQSDTNFTTPIATYSVQIETMQARKTYRFYDGETEKGYIDCTNIIQYDNLNGIHDVYVDLLPITDVMVTLIGEDGNGTYQVPMCRYEEKLEDYYGRYLALTITFLYKIA